VVFGFCCRHEGCLLFQKWVSEVSKWGDWTSFPVGFRFVRFTDYRLGPVASTGWLLIQSTDVFLWRWQFEGVQLVWFQVTRVTACVVYCMLLCALRLVLIKDWATFKTLMPWVTGPTVLSYSRNMGGCILTRVTGMNKTVCWHRKVTTVCPATLFTQWNRRVLRVRGSPRLKEFSRMRISWFPRGLGVFFQIKESAILLGSVLEFFCLEVIEFAGSAGVLSLEESVCQDPQRG